MLHTQAEAMGCSEWNKANFSMVLINEAHRHGDAMKTYWGVKIQVHHF
jgi:hypothetical protein